MVHALCHRLVTWAAETRLHCDKCSCAIPWWSFTCKDFGQLSVKNIQEFLLQSDAMIMFFSWLYGVCFVLHLISDWSGAFMRYLQILTELVLFSMVNQKENSLLNFHWLSMHDLSNKAVMTSVVSGCSWLYHATHRSTGASFVWRFTRRLALDAPESVNSSGLWFCVAPLSSDCSCTTTLINSVG